MTSASTEIPKGHPGDQTGMKIEPLKQANQHPSQLLERSCLLLNAGCGFRNGFPSCHDIRVWARRPSRRRYQAVHFQQLRQHTLPVAYLIRLLRLRHDCDVSKKDIFNSTFGSQKPKTGENTTNPLEINNTDTTNTCLFGVIRK